MSVRKEMGRRGGKVVNENKKGSTRIKDEWVWEKAGRDFQQHF